MIRSTFKPKKPKPRKCPECHQSYIPARPIAPCCDSLSCKINYSLRHLAKKLEKQKKMERAETKKKLLDLKPIQYFLRRAEKSCNAYIRARDEDEPCISCGKWDAMEFHAGHFIPVGRAKSIRFDEDNIHKQCDQCNTHFNGNATKYEIALLHKIGLINVERLKTAPKEKKWTREECQAIEAEYKAKLKSLKH